MFSSKLAFPGVPLVMLTPRNKVWVTPFTEKDVSPQLLKLTTVPLAVNFMEEVTVLFGFGLLELFLQELNVSAIAANAMHKRDKVFITQVYVMELFLVNEGFEF